MEMDASKNNKIQPKYTSFEDFMEFSKSEEGESRTTSAENMTQNVIQPYLNRHFHPIN